MCQLEIKIYLKRKWKKYESNKNLFNSRRLQMVCHINTYAENISEWRYLKSY
jgi:hypothetical protein